MKITYKQLAEIIQKIIFIDECVDPDEGSEALIDYLCENGEDIAMEVTELSKPINNELTEDEINVIMICMSYYAFRHNENTKINDIDVDYGGALYNKLCSKIQTKE